MTGLFLYLNEITSRSESDETTRPPTEQEEQRSSSTDPEPFQKPDSSGCVAMVGEKETKRRRRSNVLMGVATKIENGWPTWLEVVAGEAIRGWRRVKLMALRRSIKLGKVPTVMYKRQEAH